MDTLAQPDVWCEPAQAAPLMRALGEVLSGMPGFSQMPHGLVIGDLHASDPLFQHGPDTSRIVVMRSPSVPVASEMCCFLQTADGRSPGTMNACGAHGDSFFVALAYMLNAVGQLDRLLAHHRLPADRPENMLRALLTQQLPLRLAAADCEALATAVRLLRMDTAPRPVPQAVPLPDHGAVGLSGNPLPVWHSLAKASASNVSGEALEEDRCTRKRRLEAEPPAKDLKRWRSDSSSSGSSTPSRSPSAGPVISPSWFLPSASPVRPGPSTSQQTPPAGTASPVYGGRLLTPPPGGTSPGGGRLLTALEQTFHADIDGIWSEMSLYTSEGSDDSGPPPASGAAR